MKTYEDKGQPVEFKYVNVGSCFYCESSIYLKTTDVIGSDGNIRNAVNVITGQNTGFCLEDMVYPVKAHLVWKRM